MAAVIATELNPDVRAQQASLLGRGKAKMSTLGRLTDVRLTVQPRRAPAEWLAGMPTREFSKHAIRANHITDDSICGLWLLCTSEGCRLLVQMCLLRLKGTSKMPKVALALVASLALLASVGCVGKQPVPPPAPAPYVAPPYVAPPAVAPVRTRD